MAARAKCQQCKMRGVMFGRRLLQEEGGECDTSATQDEDQALLRNQTAALGRTEIVCVERAPRETKAGRRELCDATPLVAVQRGVEGPGDRPFHRETRKMESLHCRLSCRASIHDTHTTSTLPPPCHALHRRSACDRCGMHQAMSCAWTAVAPVVIAPGPRRGAKGMHTSPHIYIPV